ncbi:membrane protein [Aureimonas endophytica]|uniref:Membrane protein n=1 Tax=Aureimonas endophytica TaxID=2027858 RepID=A0A916ZYF5_9HYPH|nr:EamA family transporter [Aureimonas endophytica]GGE19171.1 membrane protein [Aureimonas endophytica]
MTESLSLRHFLLAVAVVAVWGTNFVVIRVALDHLPPFLFGALRFTLACLPGVFFVKRPAVPWKSLAAYGVLIGSGQFGLLYYAMRSEISPGLASLVLQMQVFFTIGLALVVAKERVKPYQLAALALGAAGIAVIAAHTDGSTTHLGLALGLLAAFSWSAGNIVAKQSGVSSMLSFVIWASLFSAPPLLVLSLLFEGWPAIREGVAEAGLATWGAVLWQTIGNTLFGYAAWGFLLSRYPAASVTPMALLVPVFGMLASFLWLGEPLPLWKLAAAALVLSGLAIGLLASRRAARRLVAQSAVPPGPSA